MVHLTPPDSSFSVVPQLNGLLFFTVAMLAAVSMVLFYVFVLFGSVIGGGYAIYALARNRALEDNGRRAPPAYLRPHQE